MMFSMWRRQKNGWWQYQYRFDGWKDFRFVIGFPRFMFGWCIVRNSDGVVIAQSK